MNIDDTKIGFEGCNIHSASYALTGNQIKIDQFIGTLRACLFFDYDNVIVNSFSYVTSWDRSNGILRFTANNQPLIFAISKNGKIS